MVEDYLTKLPFFIICKSEVYKHGISKKSFIKNIEDVVEKRKGLYATLDSVQMQLRDADTQLYLVHIYRKLVFLGYFKFEGSKLWLLLQNKGSIS